MLPLPHNFILFLPISTDIAAFSRHSPLFSAMVRGTETERSYQVRASTVPRLWVM